MKKTTLILILILHFIKLYSLIDFDSLTETQMTFFKSDAKIEKINNSKENNKICIYGKYNSVYDPDIKLEIIENKEIYQKVENGTKQVKKKKIIKNIKLKITINDQTYISETDIKQYIEGYCNNIKNNKSFLVNSLNGLSLFINGSIKLIQKVLEKKDINIINNISGVIQFRKVQKLENNDKYENTNIYLINNKLNQNNQKNGRRPLNINSIEYLKNDNLQNDKEWFDENFKFIEEDNGKFIYYFQPYDYKKGDCINCYNKIFRIEIDFNSKEIFFYRLPCCYLLKYQNENKIYNIIRFIVKEINEIQISSNTKNNTERNLLLKNNIENFFNKNYLKKYFKINHIENNNNLNDLKNYYINPYNNFLNFKFYFLNNNDHQKLNNIIIDVRKNNPENNSPFKQNTNSTRDSEKSNQENSPFKLEKLKKRLLVFKTIAPVIPFDL